MLALHPTTTFFKKQLHSFMAQISPQSTLALHTTEHIYKVIPRISSSLEEVEESTVYRLLIKKTKTISLILRELQLSLPFSKFPKHQCFFLIICHKSK